MQTLQQPGISVLRVCRRVDRYRESGSQCLGTRRCRELALGSALLKGRLDHNNLLSYELSLKSSNRRARGKTRAVGEARTVCLHRCREYVT